MNAVASPTVRADVLPPTTRPGPPGDGSLLAFLQLALGHELPNQLLAVQGLGRLLELEAAEQLGAEERDYLQRLSVAAQRAHETVHALADLVRAVRSPRPALPIILPEIIREAVAEVRRSTPGLAVRYQFPEHGPAWHLPALALRQVVIHLLRALAPGPDQPLEIGAAEQQFWLRAAGYVPLRPEKFFEPAAAGRSGAAFGLGPSLARQIVETWDGTVTLQTDGQEGCTVVVAFPTQGRHAQEMS